MPNLAFIELGSSLVHYFCESSRMLDAEISPVFYSTKTKVRSKLEQLGRHMFPERKRAISPQPIPQLIFDAVVNGKLRVSISDSRRQQAQASYHFTALERLFQECRIDAIFVWNGSGLAASIAICLARKHGKKIIFGENGYFPHTIQIDSEGVNFKSSVTKVVSRRYDKIAMDPDKVLQLKTLISEYKANRVTEYQKPTRQVKASVWSHIVNDIQTFNWRRTFRPRNFNNAFSDQPENLPEKYVLLPFQVVADSQVILYSPLVGNDMEKFLSCCHSALRKVAPDHKLVVKLHPADLRKVNYNCLKKKYPDVIWVKNCSIKKLLESANAVVTINSTVGLEALIYYKPIIALGLNFYNVDGVIRHPENLEQLPEQLHRALTEPVNKDKIDRLLYYLYWHYFTHGSWKDHSEKSYRAVASKISQLVIGKHEAEGEKLVVSQR